VCNEKKGAAYTAQTRSDQVGPCTNSLLLLGDGRAAGGALRLDAPPAGRLDVAQDGVELEGVAAGEGGRLPEHLLGQGALRCGWVGGGGREGVCLVGLVS
jgi:hypothetical protein